jgi:hypothetical protein
MIDIPLNGAKAGYGKPSGKTTLPVWIFLRFSPAISVLLYSQIIF